jgi:hypothetical protein
VIEPNRLSAPGEAGARARVEDLFARIDRLSGAALMATTVAPIPQDQRAPMLQRLEEAVARHGRSTLLTESRETIRARILARIASVYPLDAYSGVPYIPARPEDQASLVAALEDVAAVAVAEDLIALQDAAALASPARQLLGMGPLTTLATPEADRTPAWEPSAADWADADSGSARLDLGRPYAGSTMVRALIGLATAMGIVAALVIGVGAGVPLIGLLAAAAVASVGWTLATYRHQR